LLLKIALKSVLIILGKLRDVEQELEAIGENMKQLEISAEKAQEREEKLKDKIHSLMERLKVAEARFEYGEMNISKLNLRYTNNNFHLILGWRSQPKHIVTKQWIRVVLPRFSQIQQIIQIDHIIQKT
jgi:predicted nuclease with TOPRIM domain